MRECIYRYHLVIMEKMGFICMHVFGYKDFKEEKNIYINIIMKEDGILIYI